MANIAGKTPSWFTRGHAAAKQTMAQMERAFKPEFWMKDGESARFVLLDKEPINMMLHKVEVRGKTRTYTCRGELPGGCPLCGIDSPRFFSIYRMMDLRRFPIKDNKGNATDKSNPPKEKYWEVGTRLAPVIAKFIDRLYMKVGEAVRTGTSTKTMYNVMPIGAMGEKTKAVVKGHPKLDLLKDYEPRPLAELQRLVQGLGGAPADESVTTPEPAATNYLEDVDDVVAETETTDDEVVEDVAEDTDEEYVATEDE